jgi:Ca2+/H+ antiporter, TMEM165/GDT1 family
MQRSSCRSANRGGFTDGEPSAFAAIMEALFVSFGTVAIAEIGDRTQLLSLLLVTRYGHPWAILAGVLVASLSNHALAGVVGLYFGRLLGPTPIDLVVALSMIGMGFWTLVHDEPSGDSKTLPCRDVFTATVVAFFVAEIGDKTQIATAALAAAYSTLVVVIAGTTCGMIVANFPVIFLGNALAPRVPVKAVRMGAALLFIGLGIVFLARAIAGAWL